MVPGVSGRVHLHGQLDAELYMGEGSREQVSTRNRVSHVQKSFQNSIKFLSKGKNLKLCYAVVLWLDQMLNNINFEEGVGPTIKFFF